MSEEGRGSYIGMMPQTKRSGAWLHHCLRSQLRTNNLDQTHRESLISLALMLNCQPWPFEFSYSWDAQRCHTTVPTKSLGFVSQSWPDIPTVYGHSNLGWRLTYYWQMQPLLTAKPTFEWQNWFSQEVNEGKAVNVIHIQSEVPHRVGNVRSFVNIHVSLCCMSVGTWEYWCVNEFKHMCQSLAYEWELHKQTYTYR